MVHVGGHLEELYLQTMSKHLSLKYLLLSKKHTKNSHPSWRGFKKLIIGGPILGGSKGSRLKKFIETKLRLQLNNLHKILVSMFCGLGEEKRTRFRKKKEIKRKKGKKESHRKQSGLVIGMDENLKRYLI